MKTKASNGFAPRPKQRLWVFVKRGIAPNYLATFGSKGTTKLASRLRNFEHCPARRHSTRELGCARRLPQTHSHFACGEPRLLAAQCLRNYCDARIGTAGWAPIGVPPTAGRDRARSSGTLLPRDCGGLKRCQRG